MLRSFHLFTGRVSITFTAQAHPYTTTGCKEKAFICLPIVQHNIHSILLLFVYIFSFFAVLVLFINVYMENKQQKNIILSIGSTYLLSVGEGRRPTKAIKAGNLIWNYLSTQMKRTHTCSRMSEEILRFGLQY